MRNNVAIIILNYKSWMDTITEIKNCNNYLKINYRDIIVVDNCSPNDSSEKLKKESHDKGYVFIETKENKGYAAGNNVGLRYAFNHGYLYALILNNDILFENPNLITELLRVFDTEEKVAVVNPDVYSPDGYLFNRDVFRPSLFDYTLGLNNYRKKGRMIHDIEGYGYVYRPQGCCMMVDLQKLNDVGFLDEETFLYYEEPILAERLLSKGYLCACCTAVSIVHNHSKTVNTVFDKKRVRKMKNKSFSYYLRKYRHYNFIQIKLCCLFNTLKLLALGE